MPAPESEEKSCKEEGPRGSDTPPETAIGANGPGAPLYATGALDYAPGLAVDTNSTAAVIQIILALDDTPHTRRALRRGARVIYNEHRYSEEHADTLKVMATIARKFEEAGGTGRR